MDMWNMKTDSNGDYSRQKRGCFHKEAGEDNREDMYRDAYIHVYTY